MAKGEWDFVRNIDRRNARVERGRVIVAFEIRRNTGLQSPHRSSRRSPYRLPRRVPHRLSPQNRTSGFFSIPLK